MNLIIVKCTFHLDIKLNSRVPNSSRASIRYWVGEAQLPYKTRVYKNDIFTVT